MRLLILTSLLLIIPTSNIQATDAGSNHDQETLVKQQAKKLIRDAFQAILAKNDPAAIAYLNKAKQIFLENHIDLKKYDLLYKEEAEKFIAKTRAK